MRKFEMTRKRWAALTAALLLGLVIAGAYKYDWWGKTADFACRLKMGQRDSSRGKLPIPNETPLGENSPGIKNPTGPCDPRPN
jgi:hypothetical protein